MKHTLILFVIFAVVMLTAAINSRASVAPDHAIIPYPTTKADYCTYGGGNHLFRCYCDEWLRYPICKRWHWHGGRP